MALCDFRDLPAEAGYEKVSSIGMFEHVGLANVPDYLAAVHRLLRPGGLFLNHGITHDEEGCNKTVASQRRRAGLRQQHPAWHGARRLRDPRRRGPAPALRIDPAANARQGGETLGASIRNVRMGMVRSGQRLHVWTSFLTLHGCACCVVEILAAGERHTLRGINLVRQRWRLRCIKVPAE